MIEIKNILTESIEKIKLLNIDFEGELIEHTVSNVNSYFFTLYIKSLKIQNYKFELMEISPSNKGEILPIKIKYFSLNKQTEYHCKDLEIFKKKLDEFISNNKTIKIINKISKFK